MLCMNWSIYELWKILGRQRGNEVFSQWKHTSMNVNISLLKSFRIPWHWSSVLLCTLEVQKLLETINTTIFRGTDLYENPSVCLSLYTRTCWQDGIQGNKACTNENVKHIQPNLIRSGYSSCFITEDIKRLFADRMPHTQQFSLRMLS